MSKKPEMTDIDAAAAEVAEAHQALQKIASEAGAELNATRQKHVAPARAAFAKYKAKKKILETLIDRRRDLFERPKTRVLHGIKLGVKKDRGSLRFDCDDDVMVARIRAVMGERAGDFIVTTEKPVKSALTNQDEETLRKLGAELQEDVDKVHVKPAANDVEKTVQTFLDGGKS